jgi:2-methylcitrate dehydratase PrpD
VRSFEAGAGKAFLVGQLLSYFGAAVGAGRALRLDAAGTHSALGLALMQSAGSRQILAQGDRPSKAIYGAFPNQAGVQAAFLAQAGVVADCDVFGPPAGIYSMAYGGAYEPEAVTADLGSDFIMRFTSFKPWPTSGMVHSFIEASGVLSKQIAATSEIDAVIASGGLEYRQWCEPIDKKRAPENAASAANSVPFGIGKALVHGTVSPGDFTPEGLRDPEALAIAARTTCRLDAETREATVEVVLRDGGRRSVSVKAPLGDATRPMSEGRLVEKFEDCCRYAASPLSGSQVSQLVETVLNLDQLDDVRAIPALTV